MKKNQYGKLIMSVGISGVTMYGVMFLNVVQGNHIYLSATRLYMSLLMTAPMALIMLVVMRHMYEDKRVNAFIAATAISVFFTSLFFLRTQVGVGDKHYMKAMIPHHSSAILTSEQANLRDPEVRQLADHIATSQKQEIAQMKKILTRLKAE
ncbi:DUF305 domain-containing protein [Chryseolinea lacunae]|uniref:DUF305 domain-containing protein n=1 Tax=Chryseolinea lacunae TaxID=2801331 RepID=A0ABS1KXG8_9BACT|nr:DUF305 domain-containing protein [Chryseolinea lacunae]MBL0744168.1 DUF305 domain-containing protein [Chryseolinea lacunae]